ncbi:histone H2B type F-M-like [Sorex fumeus]|uniref:histone H2B type F-M-like n=1 Tax=Sorex fumeus TaxID=62283 RepID=UPI0024AD2D29|nr:histone H2B type F-M-like [Sorex fumeus]
MVKGMVDLIGGCVARQKGIPMSQLREAASEMVKPNSAPHAGLEQESLAQRRRLQQQQQLSSRSLSPRRPLPPMRRRRPRRRCRRHHRESHHRGYHRETHRCLQQGETLGFASYFCRILRSIHRNLGITCQAVSILDCVVKGILQRIQEVAAQLARYAQHSIITKRDIQMAMRLLLPARLGSRFMMQDNKATSRRTNHH